MTGGNRATDRREGEVALEASRLGLFGPSMPRSFLLLYLTVTLLASSILTDLLKDLYCCSFEVMARKKKPDRTYFYPVGRGRTPGVYLTYGEVQEQVDGFSGNKHIRCDTREEAQAFVDYWVNIDREAARQRERRGREQTAHMPLQYGHDAAAREEHTERESGLGSFSAQRHNAGRLDRAPGPATASSTLIGQRSRNPLLYNESDLQPPDEDRTAPQTDQHQYQPARRGIPAPASHHGCPGGPNCRSPERCLYSHFSRRR